MIKFPIFIQASLLALSGHKVYQQIPSEHRAGHFAHQADQLRTLSRFPPTCKVSIVLFFDHSCASLVTICSILCHFIDQSRTGDLRAKQNQKTQCLSISGYEDSIYSVVKRCTQPSSSSPNHSSLASHH